MELQFDKEIDAILRKTRDTRGVLVGDSPPKHLDADVIAAFAENAVPPKAKLLYMEHFADCDICRRMLSHSILLNSEAVAATASSVVSETVAAAIPWYSKLFRTPNLALAMGALVLTFGGILGYLVLQNRNDGNSASVAKVEEQPIHTYSGSEPVANAAASNSANAVVANSAANMSAAANAPASNPVPSASGPSADAEPNLAGRVDAPTGSALGGRDSTVTTGGVSPEAAKSVGAAAAPPPPPVAQPMLDREEKKAGQDSLKDDKRKEVLSKTETADIYSRDGSQTNAKKPAGPNRASGPRNVQQQQAEVDERNVAGLIAPAKSVGGKTFDNRNGVWYDSAYHGQSTTNVRRGTDKYKKLDDGLRSIADSIGGTVVLVWKEKAYRIQ